MLQEFGLGLRWSTLAVIDGVVTSSFVRWTWTSLGEHKFPDTLVDHRPADVETVREMMAGRYLLAAKLVDTEGLSPFATRVTNQLWLNELHSFSWLRHFRDSRDAGERRFARTLTLDWIGRYGKFNRRSWGVSITARRVLNWLRHFTLLTEDATPEQVKAISRALASQVQSLKVRRRLARAPEDRLMAAIALLGAALCDGSDEDAIVARRTALEKLLVGQIDADGMHLSRNPAVQLRFLTELTAVRQALAKRQIVTQGTFGKLLEKMHTALASLVLGSGEIGYFNGCGQQPVDLVFALQAQASAQRVSVGTVSGYGIISSGRSLVIADGGRVPPPLYAKEAHAGALSLEFSYGNELIVGNCGPAPTELQHDAALFRTGLAHSCPTINEDSVAQPRRGGLFAGRLMAQGSEQPIEVDHEDLAMRLASDGFVRKYGIAMERWVTLIGGGETLVGQDRFFPAGKRAKPGKPLPPVTADIRFHLGPGVRASRDGAEDILSLELPSGARWSFLWEGADLEIDDSVRQSAYFGFYRTQQIVLAREISEDTEIAWILTRVS